MIPLLFASLVGMGSAAPAQRLNNRLGQSTAQSFNKPVSAADTRITNPQASGAFDPAARDAQQGAQDDCFGRTNECRRRAEQAMSSDAARAVQEACFGRTNECRRRAERAAESGGFSPGG